MAKLRKLWSTTSLPGAPRRSHDSQKAAYRHVAACAEQWAAGMLRHQYVNVWVDERDGRGWQHYDRVDLADAAWTD